MYKLIDEWNCSLLHHDINQNIEKPNDVKKLFDTNTSPHMFHINVANAFNNLFNCRACFNSVKTRLFWNKKLVKFNQQWNNIIVIRKDNQDFGDSISEKGSYNLEFNSAFLGFQVQRRGEKLVSKTYCLYSAWIGDVNTMRSKIVIERTRVQNSVWLSGLIQIFK